MKSKEDILNSFYTQGEDGMPEISAPDLLNAMEAYKQQSMEEVFNAARKLAYEATTQPQYHFKTLADYIKSTEPVVTPITQQEAIGETITLVADSILPNFLPHDNTVNELSFDFSLQGNNYMAFYNKGSDGYWELSKWEIKK